MLTIADTLDAEHVQLHLRVASPADAIDVLVPMLQNDERVHDWHALRSALHSHPPCRADEADFGICIPHARTNVVSAMVMTAGRLEEDVRFPDCIMPVRYVFCIAVPQTMAQDYLRIAGALMRIFRDRDTEQALRAATNGEEFVEALCVLEKKL